jgi:hypothetical protein
MLPKLLLNSGFKECHNIPDKQNGDTGVVFRAFEAEIILETIKSGLRNGIPVKLDDTDKRVST